MSFLKKLTPASSKHISLLSSLLTSRKAREKYGQTVLKTLPLIQKAVQNKIDIQHIYYKNNSILKSLETLNLPNDCEVHLIENNFIGTLAEDTGHVSDVLATCSIPKRNNPLWETSNPDPNQNLVSSAKLLITLICDNVRDYGNLGIILKTCCYLGCVEVILTKGSVDVWNPKTLESSDGCQMINFNNISVDQTWANINSSIPLNSKIFYADSIKPSSIQNSQNYKSVNYNFVPNCPITLIIGGETEGISNHAREFCISRDGHSVFIPMRNGVESLNGGIAASMILFEMKRQIVGGGRVTG